MLGINQGHGAHSAPNHFLLALRPEPLTPLSCVSFASSEKQGLTTEHGSLPCRQTAKEERVLLLMFHELDPVSSHRDAQQPLQPEVTSEHPCQDRPCGLRAGVSAPHSRESHDFYLVPPLLIDFTPTQSSTVCQIYWAHHRACRQLLPLPVSPYVCSLNNSSPSIQWA